MTAPILFWLASFFGAVLFFTGGMLAVPPRKKRRAGAAIPEALLWEPDTERSRVEPALVALREETALARGELVVLRQGRRALEAQILTLQMEVLDLRQVSSRQLEETERQHRHTQGAWAEVEQLRAELVAEQGQRAELETRLERIAILEVELADGQIEIDRWREKLAYAEARLDEAPRAEVEEALRHDLAVAGQLLDAHAERVRRFENENAQLRQDLAPVSGLEAERDRLRNENAELRASAFAAGPAAPAHRDAIAIPAPRRGDVLQALVERVSRLGDIRAAVIADDLGLVVASCGELSEEVAAVGALFNRAGVQAQRVLPLRNVHRVTVTDDQNVVLCLSPLRRTAPFDGELALITLAVGPGPDQQMVTRLLEENPSSRSMA